MIAKREDLLRGQRTNVLRGRMPEALVSEAKKPTGVEFDTDLIEVALANIAVADDYAEWLLSATLPATPGSRLSSEFQAGLRGLKPEKHNKALQRRPAPGLDVIETSAVRPASDIRHDCLD